MRAAISQSGQQVLGADTPIPSISPHIFRTVSGIKPNLAAALVVSINAAWSSASRPLPSAGGIIATTSARNRASSPANSSSLARRCFACGAIEHGCLVLLPIRRRQQVHAPVGILPGRERIPLEQLALAHPFPHRRLGALTP
jgi:hypothetical protein